MYEGLNSPQREAVFHDDGPLLVLAGAGSGKTRVITTRIARLINECGVAQSKILAVTFTNKAAAEMRERLRNLTGKKLRGIFVGTFHSLGLKILKENIEATQLRTGFSIQSAEDQLAIVAEIHREYKLDPDALPEKLILWKFSEAKNTGLPMHMLPGYLDETYGIGWGSWFERYQEFLTNMNSVDFDDLLLLPRELLNDHAEIREKYQNHWNYYLADEFQDTNPLQFEFLKLLMKEPWNLCAVGDDDQAIYGWRGADVRIILDFKKKFPTAKIIALEQNYRSTQVILDLANAAISANLDRHPKKLWSALKEGEPGFVYYAENTEREAVFVAEQIHGIQLAAKVPLNEVAILMRTNFQSRAFEEQLRALQIPYHVNGAYQFYDRKEIRDILAYLRFMANETDERSLIRITNVPHRNIGDTTLKKLIEYARAEDLRLWDVFQDIETCPVKLTAAALAGVMNLRELIVRYKSDIHRPGNLGKTLTALVKDLNLEAEYIREGLDEIKLNARMMNIRELIQGIYHFESNTDGENHGIYEYLHFISIMTNDNTEDNTSDKVQMMTLHLAKGLEFHTVFLVGLEEGILPHKRSLETEEDNTEDPTALNEERRLFYVGITRAKRRLFLSSCLTRRSFGTEFESEPSRFLAELPEDLLITESVSGQPESENDILALLTGFNSDSD